MKRIVLMLLLVVSPGYADCVLQEGVGSDFGKIGVTTEKSIGSVPSSVQPLYHNAVLSEIVVLGGDCKTSRGIGIGDARTKVEEAYGKGKKTDLYLEKGTWQNGEPDLAGKIGDYVLVYPGVGFVISKDAVWGIMIIAKPVPGFHWQIWTVIGILALAVTVYLCFRHIGANRGRGSPQQG